MIGRRSARAEASSRELVDLAEMKILAVVGSEKLENSFHRKGKGSLTMFVSQGLVGPNQSPSWAYGKGKTVNIPLLFRYVRRRKSDLRRFWLS